MTSLPGPAHVQPPRATASPPVPGLARIVRVREGTREDLAHANLPRQLPRAGVEGERQRALLHPRIRDQKPQRQTPLLRPVTQRRQDLTIPLGHDIALLEGHPTRHPVELQQVRYLRLVLQQTPADLDPPRHHDPALFTTTIHASLARLTCQPLVLGLPQQLLVAPLPGPKFRPIVHRSPPLSPVRYNCPNEL